MDIIGTIGDMLAKQKKQFVRVAELSGVENPEDFFGAQATFFRDRFKALLANDSNYQNCTAASIQNAFMQAATFGVSFDFGEPLLFYLYKYGNELRAQLSPYGWSAALVGRGIIRSVDEPVAVYKGEKCRVDTRDGRTLIIHEADLMAEGKQVQNIALVYTKITRKDGTFFYSWIMREQFEGMKKKSRNKAIYNEIGTYKAKVLKHGLKRIARAEGMAMNEDELEIMADGDFFPQEGGEDTLPEIVDEATATEEAPEIQTSQDSFTDF